MGFWGIPNIKRKVRYTPIQDSVFEVVHNSEGNRDKSHVQKKVKTSILCLGGSHTWGIGIDQEQRYTEHLETRVDKTVFNLGHCSLGLDQICLFILQRAVQFRPSLIIVEQYPWAIHRVLSNYVNGYLKPLFYVDTDQNIRLKKIPWVARFKIFRKSIGTIYQYRKELLEFKSGIDLKNEYDPLSDPIFLYWKAQHYDYMYLLVDKILAVIRDFTNQHGIKLVFAIGAILQQFGPKSRSTLVDYELPRRRLIQLLEKNGIQFVDMTDPMLSAHSEVEPVIFADGHLSSKGHRVFSEALYHKLNERGWTN